jgi:peptidoglycan/LPS O-acetylase OafA/YrhL
MLFISNFVLEIINTIAMKRGFLALLVSVLVVAATVVWFFIVEKPIPATEIINFGVIVVLVGFGLYFAYRRFSSAHRGEPQEDELSKRIMQKTAAWSYYISLYMWVFMIWLKDRVTLDTEQVLGAGILSMAVIFFACWIVIRLRGLRNE